jgi:hypothetical protein
MSTTIRIDLIAQSFAVAAVVTPCQEQFAIRLNGMAQFDLGVDFNQHA